MIEKIIGLLSELTEVYRKLYALSEKKQKAIIANNVEAVNGIVKEEWALLSDASDLEKKRSELVKQAAGPGGSEGMTLAQLMDISSPDKREELRQISENLRVILEKQKKINEDNKALIDLHLEYMDYMVSTVLKEPQVSNMYGNSGAAAETDVGNRSILDSEA